jgi:hypothetical protein
LPSFKEILYPELRLLVPEERAGALRAARATPFDMVELFGMAAALVGVTALTRYAGIDMDANRRFSAALLNFIVALPLLAVTIGPFLIRRTRRGLRAARDMRAGSADAPR